MRTVILCGGSGTRLWPLSRQNFPKQFLALFGDKSLLQETFLRMLKVMPAESIFLQTNKENYFNVLNQIKDIFPKIDPEHIIAEPEGRNTAPAIAFAVKHLTEKAGVGMDDPILFVPSDHYIGDEDAYVKVVKNALGEVNGYVGTIGITPIKPETGYGYIKKGESREHFYKVEAFKEKPDRETAQQYITSGLYLWNSGMYLFTPGTFIQEVERHAPEISRLMRENYDTFVSRFGEMPDLPIDIAISEKSDKVIVFEGSFGWSDVGSFDSLADVSEGNNRTPGKHIGIDSKNVYVHTTNDRLVATLGVDDLIIVENNDSILVQKRGRSDEVKKIVNFMKDSRIKELEHSLIVYRPWGKYEILIDQKDHKVKKITVYPGAKLSLQAHYHRVEHWVVVKGFATITNGDNLIHLRENESTFIPAFTVHRLENPGKINLELIEVQTGNYLEEDDIIRYDDDYNRI